MTTPVQQLAPRALQYFVAAAAAKSVRTAAAELNVSASAVSRQIATLEEAFGAALFKRLPRGLELTPAGEVLLFHVQQSFQELQLAHQTISEIGRLRLGQINLALVESAALGLLKSSLSEFWRSKPNIRVSVQVLGSLEVLRLVQRGDADVGLAFNVPPGSGLVVVRAARLRLGALMSPQHPLSSRSSLRVNDLIEFPIFLPDTSLMLRSAVAEAERHWPLNVRVVTNSIGVLTLLAGTEHGIALKSHLGLDEQLTRGELVYVPLRDRRLQTQQLSLVVRRNPRSPDLTEKLAGAFAAALEGVSED